MKTKEDKIIEKSATALEDLNKLYNHDGRAVIEYTKLFDEYKKLFKRFTKTIKMNDSNGMSIMKTTESLKDTVDYTIKKAREKLFYNVGEHRKTKEFYALKMTEANKIIKQLQKELDIAHQKIAELETKQTHTTKSLFNSGTTPINEEINLPIFKDISWNDLLTKEIANAKNFNKELTVAKLSIDNFQQIATSIEESGSVTGFYRAIVRYINITLGKNTLVYYSHDNVIYLIFTAISENEIKEKIQKLNNKKRFSDIIILFSVGVAKFDNDSDTFETISEKCTLANEKALSLEKDKINLTLVFSSFFDFQ